MAKSEVIFESEALDASGAFTLGCLYAGVMIAVVVLGVSLFATTSSRGVTASLASGLRIIMPLCVVAAVGFGAWAVKVKRQASRQLVVKRAEAGVHLTVLPEVDVQGAPTLVYGWWRMPAQRGMKMLWCDVSIDGTCVARLTHEIGSLHSAPSDWDEAAPSIPPTAEHGFAVAEVAAFVKALRGVS